MRFTPLQLPDACIVDIEAHTDDRGFLARSFCRDEWQARGLDPDVTQCSISYNKAKGTLRGMHWQEAPHTESKLVRCTSGAIFDVIVDIQPQSPNFGRWHGETLTAGNRRALYVPAGFAHGFLTLESDSEVFYQISTAFMPGFGRGFLWNDPAIGIVWPGAPTVISDHDANRPILAEIVKRAV